MPERRANQRELAPRVAGVCRLCGRQAKPPRRYWCSQECVDAWMARSNPAVLRRLVFERDRGVCALCGTDTVALADSLAADALSALALRRLDHVPGLRQAVEVYAGDLKLGVAFYFAGRRGRRRGRLRDRLLDVVRIHLKRARSCPCAVCAVAAPWRWRPGRTLWEADHIWPLAEGGPLCGPEGMRTLCVRCHRRETADLAARRAAAKQRASRQGRK